MPIAIASDLASEAINFNECEVSRELLQSQIRSFFNKLTSFFKKREEPPSDISRFFKMKRQSDPTNIEGACRILEVPLDRIDDQKFIDDKYNNGDMSELLKRKKIFEKEGPHFVPLIEEMIDYLETAYKTLKERNEANAK